MYTLPSTIGDNISWFIPDSDINIFKDEEITGISLDQLMGTIPLKEITISYPIDRYGMLNPKKVTYRVQAD